MQQQEYNYERFLKSLKHEFPHLIEDLEDPMIKGLLHVQMGAFSRYAQELINTKNEIEYVKVITFIGKVNNNCTDKIEKAIYVSFFENLDFTDKKKWAHSILPPKLKVINDAIEKFWHGKVITK